MSDVLIAQEVGTVVVIETAPAELLEVVAVGPQGPVGDVNPQMPVILAATESARDTTLATIGTAALKANNLSDLASIPAALFNLGLNNVSNTSDANKPISTATQLALDGKAPSTHVGATGTAHGVATTLVAGFMSAEDKSKLDGVAANANKYSHPTGDGNLHVPATGTTNNGKVLKAGATAGSLSWGTLAKADVGLSSVDNTSDANKPISAATQTALNLKVDAASPTTTGTFTHSGNIVLSGSGKRITGDFSNATAANRVMFQTSTVDGNTAIAAIPSGTGIKSMWGAFGSSDPANSSITWLFTDNSTSAILADKTGTGTYLPMTFYAGGSERMRIDTAGNICIGGTPPAATSARSLDIEGIAVTPRILLKAVGATSNTTTLAMDVTNIRVELNCGTWPLHIYASGILQRLPGGLGYGPGAGGTVTQATSKATSVTLNKPTGQITMDTASLGASTMVSFILNNSIIGEHDSMIVNRASGGDRQYRVEVDRVAVGSAVINVTNLTGSPLSDAIKINFAVIKGTAA